MKLNMEENELRIIANSISTYVQKLEGELSELSTYRTELDNPVIVQAVALEQKRVSMMDLSMFRPFRDYLELGILIAVNTLMWLGIIYGIKHIIMW